MEKVRFEAFNVEELRVLRRACYEAGAAFGDPGHTAAERETLDDLAVEILGELKKKEAAAEHSRHGETYAAHRKHPQSPGGAHCGKVHGFLVCTLREVRPGTRILRKNAHFFVLLPGVRRENGAQKYAPGQDLVRVRQRLPLPYEHPGCRV